MKQGKRVLGAFLAAAVLLVTTPAVAMEKSLWTDYYSVQSQYTKVEEETKLYYLYNETAQTYESDGYYTIASGEPFTVTNRADSGYVFVYYEAYTKQEKPLLLPISETEERDFEGEYICYHDGLTEQHYLNQDGGWSVLEGIIDAGTVGVSEPESYANDFLGKMINPGESVTFTLPDDGTDTIYLLWIWYNDPATGDYKWQYSEFKNEGAGTANPAQPSQPSQTVSSGSPADGLNGQSGKWADFNEDVYDTVTFISTVKNAQVNGFTWPSGGTVLLKVSSSTYTLAGSKPNCIGIAIPAGLVVDIYKYYQSAGMTEPVYELLGHFDTTNGEAYTIGSGSASKGLNGNICDGSQFKESVYDSVIGVIDLLNGKASWPSSGAVLLKENGIGWTTSILENVTIPAGLVVDFYKYSKPLGSDKNDYTYRLVAHFDTTDGQPYTVDAGSHTTGSMYDQWGDVRNVYTPGTPSASYSNSYTDVAPSAWYYHPVMTLTEGGLLNGYGGGLFGPDGPLTKGQVSILVTRLVGNKVVGDGESYASYSDNTPATRAFAAIWYAGRLSSSGGSALLTFYETSLAKDAGGLIYSISSDGRLGSMWHAVYDNWRANLAAGKNIDYISSIDELPDAAEISRWIDENWEQMASILHTNAPTVGGQPDNRTVKEKTVDACETAICRAYNLGMISGVDDKGTFDPYGTLTRGQLAQMLYNMGWVEEGVLSYN